MGGIVVKIDGVTLTAPAWLVKPWGDLVLNSAADGSGAVGSLLIDDAAGTRRIRGWQSITVDEPLCSLANNGIADAPRVFTGYSGRRTYSRGPYKDGPGRYILVELYDVNVLLSTRLITGGDAVRPAETDTARLAWLIGSDYLDGLVQDFGLVNGTGLSFEATDTHGQYPSQVLQDLTSTYDQLFFAYYDQDEADVGLFFDFPDATSRVSALSISNDMADVDNDTTWFAMRDGQLDADPADVYSNVRYVYAGGVVYQTRAATNTEFFTDNGLLIRGTQIEQSKIGKATTARTFATRFLDAAANERLAISCTVRLPATHVNLIDSGMLLPVKLTHLPDYGFDDFTDMRVQNREVTQVDALSPITGELEPWYDIKLTLALTGLPTIGSGGGGPGGGGSGGPGAGGGAGPPTPFPDVPQTLKFCATGVTTNVAGYSDDISTARYQADFGSGSTTGHNASIEVKWLTLTGVLPISGWTTADVVYSWNGGAQAYANIGVQNFGLGGSPTGNICWNGGDLSACAGFENSTPPTYPVVINRPGGNPSDTLRIFGVRVTPMTAGVPETFCIELGDVSDTTTLDVVDNELGSNSGDPPTPGKPVGPETITMSGANGTTAFRFAAGSLHIAVDDTDQTGAIVTQDGNAQTFTLGFVPKTGEVVTATYIAAP